MKNQEQWSPTKYVVHRGRLRGSRDRKQVQVSSRLITDRVASCYDTELKQHSRGDLLDLGCGQAPLFETYRRLVDTVTCVDWPGSPHDVQFADILCDINQALPIPNDSFDTVICSDVLEHLHNPCGLMGEVRRVLRPGGKALFTMPFMYGLHEQPHDYHRYTRFCIAQMSEVAGLRVLEVRELGGAFDVACDLLAKLAVRIPVVGNPTSLFLQWSWSLTRRIGVFRKFDERTASRFPLEYFALLVNPPNERDG